jgi:pimeloyl-ACP methyl ester carboxylesterase
LRLRLGGRRADAQLCSPALAKRDHVRVEVRRADGSVIVCEVVGADDGRPLLLCHGLADSRLTARPFAQAARALGWRVVAPDRPGTGGTDPRRLRRLMDWVQDAERVLDALGTDQAAVMGISGGGAFAAACAAGMPGRVVSLTLVSALGLPGWPTQGMASGERLSLGLARHAPAFGGWFLGCLAWLARRSPRLFLSLVESELPGSDRRALEQPTFRGPFLASYIEAFRRGSGGVAQDLRVLTRSWGFQLDSIQAPTVIHHGDADTTVPPQHARLFAEAIPGAQLHIHPGHGHFSIMGAVSELLAQPPPALHLSTP